MPSQLEQGHFFSFGENTDDSIIDRLPPVVSQKAVVAKMRENNQTNQEYEPIYEFSEIHCSSQQSEQFIPSIDSSHELYDWPIYLTRRNHNFNFGS